MKKEVYWIAKNTNNYFRSNKYNAEGNAMFNVIFYQNLIRAIIIIF
jgi:hypothetical protein